MEELRRIQRDIQSLYSDKFNKRIENLDHVPKGKYGKFILKDHVKIWNLSIEQLEYFGQLSKRKLEDLNLADFNQLDTASDQYSKLFLFFQNKKKLDGKLYGSPLRELQTHQRLSISKNVLNMINHLYATAPNFQGVFRKPGAKVRIDQLIEAMNTEVDFTDFDSFQVYDIADALKVYFHHLPEPILNIIGNEENVKILKDLTDGDLIEFLKAHMVLLEDENRITIHALIHFLKYLESFRNVTQMNTMSLAMCLSPCLFHSFQQKPKTPTDNKIGEEMLNQKLSQRLVQLLIENEEDFFRVSLEPLTETDRSRLFHGSLRGIDLNSDWDEIEEFIKANFLVNKFAWKSFNLDQHLEEVKRNSTSRNKMDDLDITIESTPSSNISSSKTPLKLPDILTWKVTARLSSSNQTTNISDIIYNERNVWDSDIKRSQVVQHASADREKVCRYLLKTESLQPPREMRCKVMMDKSERRDIVFSCNASDIQPQDCLDDLKPLAQVYFEFFHIETMKNGSVVITYSSMIDMKGYHGRWYDSFWPFHSVRKVRELIDYATRKQ